MAPPSNLTTKSGKAPDLEEIKRRLTTLANLQVLVGVPEDQSERQEEAPGGMTNAALAYIHDQGMPEQNIPQREFMRPGIEDIQDEVTRRLKGMAKTAITETEDRMAQQATSLGLRAASSIKARINEGIPPPLAESTLAARARKGRKGAKDELQSRREGNPPSTASAKPLIDSGQLRNSITYVIRSRGGNPNG